MTIMASGGKKSGNIWELSLDISRPPRVTSMAKRLESKIELEEFDIFQEATPQKKVHHSIETRKNNPREPKHRHYQGQRPLENPIRIIRKNVEVKLW